MAKVNAKQGKWVGNSSKQGRHPKHTPFVKGKCLGMRDKTLQDFLKHYHFWNFEILRCLTTLEQGLGDQTLFKLALILNIENVLNNRISSRITLQEKNILKKNYGHLKG